MTRIRTDQLKKIQRAAKPKMNPKKATDDTDQDGSVKKIQRAPKTKMNPKKRHGLHGSGRIRTDQVEKIRRASVSVRGNNFLSMCISINPWKLFFIREHQC